MYRGTASRARNPQIDRPTDRGLVVFASQQLATERPPTQALPSVRRRIPPNSVTVGFRPPYRHSSMIAESSRCSECPPAPASRVGCDPSSPLACGLGGRPCPCRSGSVVPRGSGGASRFLPARCRGSSLSDSSGKYPAVAAFSERVPYGVVQVGSAPTVVGARPCCCAMMAASTTWRSVGSMASGPPANGTCQTWVMNGVVASRCDPISQRPIPSISLVTSLEHRFVCACHCTRQP